jgi:uncharacterized protein YciI
MDLFLVTRSWGLRWDDSRKLEEQEDWVPHAQFMNALQREGFVALGGPIVSTREVLLVVRASDEKEIESRLSADPWTRNGLLHVTSIRGWSLRLGSLPGIGAP